MNLIQGGSYVKNYELLSAFEKVVRKFYDMILKDLELRYWTMSYHIDFWWEYNKKMDYSLDIPQEITAEDLKIFALLNESIFKEEYEDEISLYTKKMITRIIVGNDKVLYFSTGR